MPVKNNTTAENFNKSANTKSALRSKATVSTRSYRTASRAAADFYPTPPSVTAALLQNYPFANQRLSDLTCLEPACGEGHMSKVLQKSFKRVVSSDAYYYGYGDIKDFLSGSYTSGQFDCVITNPPFRLSEKFVMEALRVSKRYVAIIARTSFLEGVRRYQNIFKPSPPTLVLQFTRRISFAKGQISSINNGATAFAWYIWDKEAPSSETRVIWTGD
ncbi:Eco57I restriction-modification methylase domain-containing protein [Methylobacterium goesingense]|uniref:Methyltransferase n=1 Tax=Methylobacterium goesingense TaxID=243690 RepID=A0ABV2LCM9_9HYPH|nr:Eco57I restriction-modification methylase domain-containing protein [Methylobacterium goesingense]GJD76579.1 hypothetical protein CFIICLFH_4837 [Methylobacterium goesingense]